jgi:hypothetical protein
MLEAQNRADTKRTIEWANQPYAPEFKDKIVLGDRFGSSYHFPTPRPLTVEEFGGAYRKPGHQIGLGVNEAFIIQVKRENDLIGMSLSILGGGEVRLKRAVHLGASHLRFP